ncbi:hypothetical protein Bcp1_228 [Bacillus phage Bcp1]|uniref:Uncharacterized protein n=1 Tax=Bacillus phage Bcp1 TaxID=584892 RepID=A0A024E3Y0_9CAUD|nr:hypothetical protein Bcp1_228 [Bacillus phage Bcp1]AHZ60321.1 hypothetical protein Bcp1_228 [Bacillus phage Bcp1]
MRHLECRAFGIEGSTPSFDIKCRVQLTIVYEVVPHILLHIMGERNLKARGKPVVSKTTVKRFDSSLPCQIYGYSSVVECGSHKPKVDGSIPSNRIALVCLKLII